MTVGIGLKYLFHNTSYLISAVAVRCHGRI
nr:MAG TPA: hypothetical protein [Caudoviricetes sp.]